MTDFDRQSKACPYCGQPVKVSSYRCQSCGRSLAAVEQREWESSDTSSESFHDSDEEGGIQIPPAVAAACLIAVAVAVVVAALYGFFPDRSSGRGKEEFPAAFSKPVPIRAATAGKKAKPATTSLIRLHDDPTTPSTKADRPETGSAEIAVAEKQGRDERIGRVADEVFEDLRRESALKPYTIHLKSGREIVCNVVGESDTQLTIKMDGFTATLDRESIESIERQSPRAAEMKITALARATEIVDRRLVRDGEEWITPEEKARRSKKAGRRKSPARPEAQDGEAPKGAAAKTESDDFNAKTDKEKLEALLALVRKKKVVNADFFGGALHIEDTAGDQPDDEESSFVSFEARAEGLDVSQLFYFLKFDGAVSGECNADVEADFDQSDLSTLNGDAQVTCKKMTLPPIYLSSILTPPNKRAALEVVASAEDGTVIFRRLRLVGTAYNIEGTATIRLADTPEKSIIEGSFAIFLSEAPTFTDKGTSGNLAQYMLDTFAGSGAKLFLNLSGPLPNPNVELTADTPLGSVAWKIN